LFHLGYNTLWPVDIQEQSIALVPASQCLMLGLCKARGLRNVSPFSNALHSGIFQHRCEDIMSCMLGKGFGRIGGTLLAFEWSDTHEKLGVVVEIPTRQLPNITQEPCSYPSSINVKSTTKQTPWLSVRKPSPRPAKLLLTFANRGLLAQRIPIAVISGFLDRSRYYFFHVAP
jgi:hypothetical protein